MMAMEYFIDSEIVPFIKFPIVSVFLFVSFLLIAIEITVSAVDTITYHLLTEEQKIQLNEAIDLSFKDSEWYKKLMAKLTKTEPLEGQLY
jgi:cytochrome c oxidase cbb3-type subunit 3